ncbi:MAG: serine hydrolase domain-containing protein, partial [Alphaproteobacteria bacterium]
MLEGYIHPDFGLVSDVLQKQLPETGFGGSALTIYHRGECVVDVWGGTKNSNNDPWEKDTLSLSFSTTKGIMSTLLHMLMDQGKAQPEDKVAVHWPEFAQNGKQDITIRTLMCHEAGLYRVYDMVDSAQAFKDWDGMVKRMEEATPYHTPGTAHGYHGITYGWLIGGLIEKITGKALGDVLDEMLVQPLGLDGAYCGLPVQELARRTELTLKMGNDPSPADVEKREKRLALIKKLTFGKIDLSQGVAALSPPKMEGYDFNGDEEIQVPVPGANGCFTARSLARIYGAIANGGELDGTRILSAEAVSRMGEVQNRTMDKALIIPMHWRMGYHRIFTYPFVGPKARRGFGHAGFGGSGAWADPVRAMSLGLTVNSGIGTPTGDARLV